MAPPTPHVGYGCPMCSPTIRIRPGILTDIRNLREIKTDEAQARLIGVDRKTLYRINEGAPPSPAFIAGAVVAFNLPFDAMFEVVNKATT